MKMEFSLNDSICKLLLDDMSIKEISSFLNLDNKYILYLLGKIRNDIIKEANEERFIVAHKIDCLFNCGNKSSILRAGNSKLKQMVINLILSGKKADEIVNNYNIVYMYYVSILKYTYYDLFIYGNDYEKKYLPVFRKRIRELNNEVNIDSKDQKVLTSIDDKIIIESFNNDIVLNGKTHQVYDFDNNDFDYIVISDTHFGSVFENVDYLRQVYDYAVKHNIKYIFHSGDLIEGQYSNFDRCPIKYKNIMAQIEHVINDYCYDDSITNLILFGNHDLYALINGIDIEKELSERKDFKILGYRSAYLHIKNEYLALKHEIARIKNNVIDEQVFLSFHGHSHHYRCIYNNRNTIFKVPTLSNMWSTNLSKVNRGFFVGSINYDGNDIKESTIKYINFDNPDNSFVYKKIKA